MGKTQPGRQRSAGNAQHGQAGASDRPLPDQVADRLARFIARRHRPGDRLPTAVDLADDYGVSPVTMHKALRQLADAGVVSRHRRAGTFVKRPPTPERPTLGLLAEVPRSAFGHAGYLNEFFIGLGMEAFERHIGVRLVLDRHATGPTRAIDPSDVPWDALDGAVMVGPLAKPSLARAAGALPVVLTDASEPSQAVSTVRADYGRPVRWALDHLLALGHRRIGYAGITYMQRDPEFRCPRYEAFLEHVHRDDRIEYHPEWGLNVRWFEQARSAIERILQFDRPQRPTALLVRDMAWPLIHEMHARGLTPGRDLSIVSLSDIEPWARWLSGCRLLGDRLPWMYAPPDRADRLADDDLHAVAPVAAYRDSRAMARGAIEELVRRWDDPTLGPGDRVIADFRTQAGNSAGPPA